MKKFLILALISAFFNVATLTIGLILLEPLTTIIVWSWGSLSILASFVCFLEYHSQRYTKTKEKEQLKSTKNKLEKVKEKLSEIQKKNHLNPQTSFIKKHQNKGMQKGIDIALKIIGDIEND